MECFDHENILESIPAFHGIFKRPSPFTVKALAAIRARTSLPPPSPSEPLPGAWGLRSDTTYTLALHFRGMPLGFEPLAPKLKSRFSELESFWKTAAAAAAVAAAIASCRGLELVIYFATDDVATLRPVASEKLAKFGRLVFGLDQAEVGHTMPSWAPNDLEEVRKAKADAAYFSELAKESEKHHQVMAEPSATPEVQAHHAKMVRA